MKSLKEKARQLACAASVAVMSLPTTITSFASGDPFDLDYLKDNSTNNGMFEEVTDATKGFIASGYTLVTTVCTGIALLLIIVIAIKFMRGGRKTEEAKDDILNWLVGACLLFGAVALVSLLAGIFTK